MIAPGRPAHSLVIGSLHVDVTLEKNVLSDCMFGQHPVQSITGPGGRAYELSVCFEQTRTALTALLPSPAVSLKPCMVAGVVGKDPAGRTMIQHLSQAGINTEYVLELEDSNDLAKGFQIPPQTGIFITHAGATHGTVGACPGANYHFRPDLIANCIQERQIDLGPLSCMIVSPCGIPTATTIQAMQRTKGLGVAVRCYANAGVRTVMGNQLSTTIDLQACQMCNLVVITSQQLLHMTNGYAYTGAAIDTSEAIKRHVNKMRHSQNIDGTNFVIVGSDFIVLEPDNGDAIIIRDIDALKRVSLQRSGFTDVSEPTSNVPVGYLIDLITSALTYQMLFDSFSEAARCLQTFLEPNGFLHPYVKQGPFGYTFRAPPVVEPQVVEVERIVEVDRYSDGSHSHRRRHPRHQSSTVGPQETLPPAQGAAPGFAGPVRSRSRRMESRSDGLGGDSSAPNMEQRTAKSAWEEYERRKSTRHLPGATGGATPRRRKSLNNNGAVGAAPGRSLSRSHSRRTSPSSAAAGATPWNLSRRNSEGGGLGRRISMTEEPQSDIWREDIIDAEVKSRGMSSYSSSSSISSIRSAAPRTQPVRKSFLQQLGADADALQSNNEARARSMDQPVRKSFLQQLTSSMTGSGSMNSSKSSAIGNSNNQGARLFPAAKSKRKNQSKPKNRNGWEWGSVFRSNNSNEEAMKEAEKAAVAKKKQAEEKEYEEAMFNLHLLGDSSEDADDGDI